MTVVNPKSISGITSITTASGSDNLLTIHTSDANNTERFRIDSTGSAKVGSGVTLSPDGDIFTTGISTFGGNIQITSATPEIELNAGGPRFRVPASNTLSIHSGAGLGSADEERVRFTAGKVGINTTSPEYALDLRMDNDVTSGIIQIIRNNTANGNGSFYCTDLAQVGNFSFGMPDNTNAFTIVDGLGNSGSERLRINSAGSVGIGTDDPTSKLHLAGRLSVHHSAVDTEGEFLRIGRTDLPLIRYHSIKAKHGGATANNYITFNLHNTSDTTSQLEVLRLRGDGMVGIDLINPDVKLSVKGASVGGTANDQNDTLKLINYTANTNQLIFGTKRLSNGSDWQTTCERIQRRIDVTKMGYIDFGRVNDGYKMVIGNESQGDVLECKADGDVVVTNGDVVFAAGHGINFSQNANHAQANNELLDDYEEGTFTPSFKAGNNSNNASTTVNEAQYTKIGNVVYFRLYIQLAGHATGTTGGDAFIVDLPFTNIAGHAAVSVSYFANWAANQMFVGATVQPSAAHILFRHNISVSSATANMDYDNNLQVGSAVIVSGCYITTAS